MPHLMASAVATALGIGFRSMRLRIALDTDASQEQIATLLRLTERYCVVFQTLARPPELSVAAAVAPG